MTPVIRTRRPEDLPALAEVMAEQQPVSRYPVRWPFPYPLEDFIARSEELAAWTAEVDGVPVGHVSVQPLQKDPPTDGVDLAAL